MIGKKVKVFWPVDESWYTGTVQEYDGGTGEHRLRYPDGDTEWVKIGEIMQANAAGNGGHGGSGGHGDLGGPSSSSLSFDPLMSPIPSSNSGTDGDGRTAAGHPLDDDRDWSNSNNNSKSDMGPSITTSGGTGSQYYGPPGTGGPSYPPPPGAYSHPPPPGAMVPYGPSSSGGGGAGMPPHSHMAPPPPPPYGMYGPPPGGGYSGLMYPYGGGGGGRPPHHHHPHGGGDAASGATMMGGGGGGGGDLHDSSADGRRKTGPKPWTKEEDALLLNLVHTMQWPMKWTVVAHSLPDRTGKQCRERYVNHLNPRLKSSDWTPLEDATIFHLYNTIGSHWAKMSKIIPGRTDNGIKNRFHNIRRQYEREDTHRLRLSSVDDFPDEIRHDRLRKFPDHLTGKAADLWDMKSAIGVLAAQSVLGGNSSANRTNPRFGPFRVVAAGDDDDNDDEIVLCVRCGLCVPSVHTGPEVCTKTGWCQSCARVPPNVSGNLLRECLNLRRVTGAAEVRHVIEASAWQEWHRPGPGGAWPYSTTTNSKSSGHSKEEASSTKVLGKDGDEEDAATAEVAAEAPPVKVEVE